jgi:hypothetical protein
VKVSIDKHGSPSSTFQFTCHGRRGTKRRFSESSTHLKLERGKVTRPVTDVCQGGLVRVAFDQDYTFEVDTGANRMVKYPLSASINPVGAFDYEILSTFFHEHQLTPTFIDNNRTNPQWDTEAEQTGLVALVRAYISFTYRVGYNEADIAVGYFPHELSMVQYSHAISYGHYHWVSRAPRELLPIWNMLGIFDFHSWVFLIFTMFVVYGFLLVTAKVGACYGLTFYYQEIPCFPVR